MESAKGPTPLVSVLTPAHNEERYIGECIESVLAQSHTNLEYIIVDNASTDGTAGIADRYAASDPRIRVVHRGSLLPAVANFNFALRQIGPASRYAKIVFADDWIFPECLERMVALAEANPTVGIVGAYGLEGQSVLWQGLEYGRSVVDGRTACRERLLGGPYVFGSETSVLYRSDLVRGRDPFYNEGNAHAVDSEACFELLESSDFAFVHQILTFSRRRPGSLLEASMAVNASAGDMLREIVHYGPVYLTAEEYSRRLGWAIAQYYDFLASAVRQNQASRFWEFHRGVLTECGMPFRRGRLACAFLRRMANRLRVAPPGPRLRWGL